MSRRASLSKRLELFFEGFLWNFRLVALVPVVFGVLGTLLLFWSGSQEVLKGMWEMLAPKPEYTQVLGSVIGGIDLYLIGIVLMLFSFGIYELFISEIDFRLLTGRDWPSLEVRSLEELKEKLLKSTVLVLIVSFFKQVIEEEPSSYLECLALAGSILLLSLSGYLLRAGKAGDH